MRFENVSLLSVASVEAPNRIASTDLEARLGPFLRRLGFASGVLASLSGVIARRFWDEGTQPSDVAARAGELALARAGIDRSRVGMLVNTSFNVRGEPIVCNPEDAYRCFMSTEMDYLSVGPFLLERKKQPGWDDAKRWKRTFEADCD